MNKYGSDKIIHYDFFFLPHDRLIRSSTSSFLSIIINPAQGFEHGWSPSDNVICTISSVEGLKLMLAGLEHSESRADLDSGALSVQTHWLSPGTIYLTTHNLTFTAPARFIGLPFP